ncbi:hypothetical protein NLJ89_g3832 [Agrocybe chaxingu]|uniref:CxC2-like cysteine cluster KDZ transposase-associated domain-containing protein n=1 Tax=Agrocybe chaxingu TaxID=84603 RepID=A0A9W8K4Z8_9AGAR|nr:hypothetical protein NLJ89_g3832 [Agrocybe chaxingu]
MFHELHLQGKTTAYDFYETLAHRTDNISVLEILSHYTEFHRALRLWRSTMALKRAGHGQDPGGIENTSNGELMVECPACPHPGRNLPERWDKAGSLQYLYILYLAVDANFKLKGKDRGLTDIELTPGWGAFVHEGQYQAHLNNYVDQPEINSCESEHDAIVRAGIRSSPGYSVSGAGLAMCSRHSLVRKNGVGDLQKGERYSNMDFIILSALKGVTLPWIIITYDIACQWSKNFWKQMKEYPPEMQIDPKTRVDAAIPGWHINGHGQPCRTKFALSYLDGAGRTCGDEIEAGWSHTNSLALSVREMAPAVRHETLNDNWYGWNFRKITRFPTLFAKRFKEARKMATKHRQAFVNLSDTFQKATIEKWDDMVKAWKKDHAAPNPFDEPRCETTLQDVRLELSHEDTSDTAKTTSSKHKVTMTGFLTIGLELEDRQYVLRYELSQMKEKKTSKQLADLQEKRATLSWLIQNFREVQLHYTPCMATLLSATTASDLPTNEHAENVALHLPSSWPPHLRSLPEMAIVRDPSPSTYHQSLWQFKKINISGTGNRLNTRILTLYNRFNTKIKRCAFRYRTARSALVILDPNGKWQDRLRVLHDKDIHGPGRDPDDATSKGRYEMSWIWLVARPADVELQKEEELNEGMRVEWAKGQARAERWEEELLIVQEEMRRVISFFRWKADWWKSQASRRQDTDPITLGGISAYAYKQADIGRQLARCCAKRWIPILKEANISPEWASQFEDLKNTDTPVKKRRSMTQTSPNTNHAEEEEEEEEEDRDDDEDQYLADAYNFED